MALGFCLPAIALASAARAQDDPAPPPAEPAAANVAGRRPAIELVRWTEDWTALADPAMRDRPLDALKHIPLSDDPRDFISLGLNVRERYEHQDANLFGTVGQADDQLLSRLQIHADLRLRGRFEAFVQLEEVDAPGARRPGPADENRGDLRQAFVGWRGGGADRGWGVRVGRQEVAFDLERFVSIREGPNVRQAFDAVWGELRDGPWRLQALVSHPVQYRPGSFDDVGDRHLAFHALRVEWRGVGAGSLSAYVARYAVDGAAAGPGTRRDRRDIADVRWFAPAGRLQWDVEGMLQGGERDGRDVSAWAVGARARYLLATGGWRPRAGLQFDAASGDPDPAGGMARTFNPLFPNGLYLTQAGYTGFANLIHLKPTLTADPTRSVTLLAGLGLQWRQTTGDAVYVQPSIPVPRTAGAPGRWTGAYLQGRADWRVTPNLRASAEAVRFDVGGALRRAGGRDANYAALELAFAW